LGRTQAENIAAARAGAPSAEGARGDPAAPPRSLTLERAIKYFEGNAAGELAPLYLQTAKWLREMLTLPTEVKTSIREAIAEAVTPERVKVLRDAIRDAAIEGNAFANARGKEGSGDGAEIPTGEIPGV
jgi:cytochrome P450